MYVMKANITRDLRDNDWMGIVVNNKDETFSGRCQVKVFSIMDEFDNDLLPWATPKNNIIFGSSGAGSLSVPKIGQIVRVQFNNGDIYSPEYKTIQNIDNELINKIKEDYEGTHVILYDMDVNLSIIFQPNSGLLISFVDSFFQITPDAMITIQTPNANSILQFEDDIVNLTTKNEVNVTAGAKANITADEVIVNGKNTTKIGPGPYNHALLAEPFWSLMSTMARTLDAKYPATPGVTESLVETVKQSATSANVLISQ